ncbi:helix-turn-helix protein [Bacteriophage DSS3_MAL1]|nr:helix-turn-helix protein [Bacteriophage DSS3_MAL1]
MDWGTSIKALRLRQGLKQAALADMLGLDQATVSRWERGASTPTIAVQKQVRRKIEEISGDAPILQDLFERVVSSPFKVILTDVASFKTVAASGPALEYFGLGDRYPDYDWAAHAPTKQQSYVYDVLVDRKKMFSDPTIHCVESCVALRMPQGEVMCNCATYYPVRVEGGTARLLIRLHGKQPYEGGEGSLIVHRVTGPPEVITIPEDPVAARRAA